MAFLKISVFGAFKCKFLSEVLECNLAYVFVNGQFMNPVKMEITGCSSLNSQGVRFAKGHLEKTEEMQTQLKMIKKLVEGTS